MGRGDYRNTRTKSRGRVEVREGGGLGWGGVEEWDNCNSIINKYI